MSRQRFLLLRLNEQHEVIGELHPEHGATVTIQTGAPVGRTLTGVVLRGDDLEVFDPDRDRLQPVMVDDGAMVSLGVFLPTVAALHRDELGDALEVHGHDQGYLLADLCLRAAHGVTQGTNVSDAIQGLAVTAGVVVTEIADVPVDLGTDLAWPTGTRVADPMGVLARLAGLTTPWFDRDGRLRVTPLPYVGADAPRVEWGPGDASTLAPAAVEVTDRWNIPNEWLVITKSDQANIAGRYLLPASHPRSQANGVRPIIRTIDVPGLASTAQCQDRARDFAQRDSKVHTKIDVAARIDPVIDQHDVIRYRGRDYLLASASIPLTVGADMSVTLRESLVSDSQEVAA